MNSQPRIFAFHLLNDRSGSPKVLQQFIHHWVKSNRSVHLYTSLHQNGFLSNIAGVKYYNGWYIFKSNPLLRLLSYSISQILLIIKMWNKIKKNDIVYVNTVLPFGAAVIGKIKGARVIYHIHESTVNPKILKWFLFKVVKHTAHDIINVSQYVQQSHNISSVQNHLIYNAIENSFLENVLTKEISEDPKNVLMVCSLKSYKGLNEFIQLAKDNPNYVFRLILNASRSEIDKNFKGNNLPKNLTLNASQKNLHPFYQWADVVVNLSKPNEWIETFGLTILEGMAYGLPSIVPPVGGILEVIEAGVTGYAVDSRDRENLNIKLQSILSNPILYRKMCFEAKKRLSYFNEKVMLEGIEKII